MEEAKKWTEERIAQVLFLTVGALFITKLHIDNSMFLLSLAWPDYVYWGIRGALLCVIFYKVSVDKPYRSIEWLVTIAAYLIFGISWALNGGMWQVDVPILMLGAAYIPARKMLKGLFCIQLFNTLMTFFACVFGATSNRVIRDFSNNVIGQSFGFVDQTSLAAHVVFLILMLWALYANFELWQCVPIAFLLGIFYRISLREADLDRFSKGAYSRILQNENWVVLITLLVLYGYFGYKMYCHKQKKMIVFIICVLLMSFIGDYAINPVYNPLIPMMFAKYQKKEKHTVLKKKVLLGLEISILPILGLLVFVKPIAQFGRTLYYMYPEVDAFRKGMTVVVILAVLLFGVGGLGYLLFANVVREQKNWYLLSVPVVAIIALGILSSGMYKAGAQQYERDLTMEEEVLNLLSEADLDAAIYIEDIPYLYQQKMEDFRSDVYTGIAAKDLENCVYLAKKDGEQLELFEAGYFYLELSEQHCLYTNDRDARILLVNNGYRLTPYDSSELEYNLGMPIMLNGLEWTEDMGVLLDGPNHSMWNCPWENTCSYQGTVLLEMTVRLEKTETPEAVASFFITDDQGEIIYANTILEEDFERVNKSEEELEALEEKRREEMAESGEELPEIRTYDDMLYLTHKVTVEHETKQFHIVLVASEGTVLEVQKITTQRLR